MTQEKDLEKIALLVFANKQDLVQALPADEVWVNLKDCANSAAGQNKGPAVVDRGVLCEDPGGTAGRNGVGDCVNSKMKYNHRSSIHKFELLNIMSQITQEYVKSLTSITDDFLCKMTDNIYEVTFLAFKIRDVDSGQVLFQVSRSLEDAKYLLNQKSPHLRRKRRKQVHSLPVSKINLQSQVPRHYLNLRSRFNPNKKLHNDRTTLLQGKTDKVI